MPGTTYTGTADEGTSQPTQSGAGSASGGVSGSLAAMAAAADLAIKKLEALVLSMEAAEMKAKAMNALKEPFEQATAEIGKMESAMDTMGSHMEQLDGGVKTAAQGITATMTLMVGQTRRATQEAINDIMKAGSAYEGFIKKIGETSSTFADGAANKLALLKSALESGQVSLAGWMGDWQTTFDQFEQLLAKNPGTEFAKQIQTMLDALMKMKNEAMSGEIKPTEHINI